MAYLSSGNLMGVLTHPTKWSQGTLRSGVEPLGNFPGRGALPDTQLWDSIPLTEGTADLTEGMELPEITLFIRLSF